MTTFSKFSSIYLVSSSEVGCLILSVALWCQRESMCIGEQDNLAFVSLYTPVSTLTIGQLMYPYFSRPKCKQHQINVRVPHLCLYLNKKTHKLCDLNVGRTLDSQFWLYILILSADDNINTLIFYEHVTFFSYISTRK